MREIFCPGPVQLTWAVRLPLLPLMTTVLTSPAPRPSSAADTESLPRGDTASRVAEKSQRQGWGRGLMQRAVTSTEVDVGTKRKRHERHRCCGWWAMHLARHVPAQPRLRARCERGDEHTLDSRRLGDTG